MNWKKIYIDLINKARSENRVKNSQYYELHHIFPKFMFLSHNGRNKGHLPGNPDEKTNLVFLTHREHFIAHLILYRIFEKTRYCHQCLTSILIMTGGSYGFEHTKNEGRLIYGSAIKKTKLYKNIREKARKSLSESKKGKFIAKWAKTGERYGWIENNDPKVLSGELIHHSSGRKMSDEEKKKRKDAGVSQGKNNGRHNGIEDEVYVESYLKLCDIIGRPIPYLIWRRYCQKNNLPTFKGGRKGLGEKMISAGTERTGIPFIYDDWYLKNKKGNELFQDTMRKLCLK